MATVSEWAQAYARQAEADFQTFELLQSLAVPPCHRLMFLQMACEKLVKAHLCHAGAAPQTLQTSHAYIAGTLPVVLRQQVGLARIKKSVARLVLRHAKHLAQEIELLAPAVKRGGVRPDNCEYPWVDAQGLIHLPLHWSFNPSRLILLPAGRNFLKILRLAITRLLTEGSG